MIEQYARATQSTNLRDTAHKNATDILKAVALSGQTLGPTLIRLKAGNDATVFNRTLDWLTERLQRKNKSIIHARSALLYWIADTCPACMGRGKQLIDGAPIKSDIDCQHCHGTGKRPQPDNTHDIVNMLEDIYRSAMYNARKKMLDNY